MVNELDMLKRARQYMLLLSQGIDPVDGEAIDENTYHNERIIACFSYVSGILDKMIKEQENVEITVSLIASEAHNSSNKALGKIQPSRINEWLVEEGYLYRNQKRQLVATDRGIQLGIKSEERVGKEGKAYMRNIYTRDAMNYIIENVTPVSANTVKMTYEDKQYTVETFTGNDLLARIASDTRNCYIIADASVDVMAGTGTYVAILLFNNKSKVLRLTNATSSNRNTLVLEGMIEAAKCIKKPSSVVLLTGHKLGFDRFEGYRDSKCNEVLRLLYEKNCSVMVVLSTPKIITNIISKYATEQ